MQLTISLDHSGDIISVDVPESLSLEDFKAYLSAETGVDAGVQSLRFNGQELVENKPLSEFQIHDNDLLQMSKKQEPDERIEMIRQQVLADPNVREQVRSTQPSLFDALNDPARFRSLIMEQVSQEHQQTSSNQAELLRLQQDPDNPANQERILELIRQEAIEENMKLAWDISPESFTTVNMLYIKLKINGVDQVAMVDSGAAMTTISPSIAEEVGLARLIDKRYKGQAVGIGTQQIGGRIHSAPIEIGDTKIELPCSFYVVDTHVGILFGLDMLRRHRCTIDLERDVLVIGQHIEAKFLSESEIPRKSLGGNIFQREN
ncbi:DNA damage-inducible v-SNARE binding protein, putative [Candida dubliniensis CD36]|uniref:DNA damage-inducible protein 1 n=1 Tax=Candida dubliniensis (strain CD36 / ATCC MYA-646 / CBS 7987 / NCPF 3949 / NRRL Y-17841) TaxID=573826 RepID=B9WA56_CANDC|nr:DNA damage-inducible v-SNARE binding protein, putative [Candida dubliniensis CD36]CAX45695.1 DNA damage-inducible v-SNARE binding protein, putative [Candida dubliniensis CD36]